MGQQLEHRTMSKLRKTSTYMKNNGGTTFNWRKYREATEKGSIMRNFLLSPFMLDKNLKNVVCFLSSYQMSSSNCATSILTYWLMNCQRINNSILHSYNLHIPLLSLIIWWSFLPSGNRNGTTIGANGLTFHLRTDS